MSKSTTSSASAASSAQPKWVPLAGVILLAAVLALLFGGSCGDKKQGVAAASAAAPVAVHSAPQMIVAAQQLVPIVYPAEMVYSNGKPQLTILHCMFPGDYWTTVQVKPDPRVKWWKVEIDTPFDKMWPGDPVPRPGGKSYHGGGDKGMKWSQSIRPTYLPAGGSIEGKIYISPFKEGFKSTSE